MARETVFEPQTLTFTQDLDDEFNHIYTGTAFPFVVGAQYTVLWGDTEYTVTMRCMSAEAVTAPYLGSGVSFGAETESEYPFTIYHASEAMTGSDAMTVFKTDEEGTERTVGVYLADITLAELENSENLYSGEVTGFAFSEDYGGYVAGTAAAFTMEAGKRYMVSWNGGVYLCTAQDMSALMPGMVVIGNAENYGFAGNGEPFLIGSDGSTMLFLSTGEIASAAVEVGEIVEAETEEAVYYSVSSLSLKAVGDAIREKTGNSNDLGFPEGMVNAISGITADGSMPDDVHQVTFMDGDRVLWVRSVADGDNCADVAVRGLIETPAKESTADTVYTHSGWSLTDGGDADEAALSAVTENRTVYAAFTSAVRKYTVTYYDDDSATVLKTEQLAYGSTPSYKPTKTGYIIDGWTPALSTVTGDASYTAVWTDKLTFAEATWEDIARVSAAGTASQHFALGNTRTININGAQAEIFIAGFGHDDLADGSGKAGITVLTRYVVPDLTATPSYAFGSTETTFDKSPIDTAATNLLYTLDSDLRAVVKNVAKPYDAGLKCTVSNATTVTVNRKVWVPSLQEIGRSLSSSNNYVRSLGTKYAYIPTKIGVSADATSTVQNHWVRNLYYQDTSYTRNVLHYSSEYKADLTNAGLTANLIVGFCI